MALPSITRLPSITQGLILIAAAICIAAICLTLPLAAQTITKNITYTKGQTADLYQPTTPGPNPIILYIHGGAWIAGSKSDYKRLATDLAAKGYAGFAINYSLDANAFPTSWLQARDAIIFLRAHAAEYHIDPARIIVAGDSAGGELAALVALAPNGPASRPGPALPGPAVPVFAAIIFNGVFNMHNSVGVITRYIGTDCGLTKPAPACDDASPQNQVHPGAPPFFVGHGTKDDLVPFTQAQIFTDQLRKTQNTVTLYPAQGAPHSYWQDNHYYSANLAAVEAFLETLSH